MLILKLRHVHVDDRVSQKNCNVVPIGGIVFQKIHLTNKMGIRERPHFIQLVVCVIVSICMCVCVHL